MPKANAKTTPVDPIFALISEARERAQERDKANDAADQAVRKLGEDPRFAQIEGVSHLRRGFHGVRFGGHKQINSARKTVEMLVRGEIGRFQDAIKKKDTSESDRRDFTACIARRRLELRHCREVAEFLHAELNREDRRLEKLRQNRAYKKAVMNRTKAGAAAWDARQRVADAKPRSLEGAAAQIEFLLDPTVSPAGFILREEAGRPLGRIVKLLPKLAKPAT